MKTGRMRVEGNVNGKLHRYTDGEIIFEEGSTGREIYFIVSGKVEVSQRVSGKKMVMATLDQGEFFGEMAALTGNVRSMTITAVGHVYLYELSLTELVRYMQNNPQIMRDIYTSLAERLDHTDRQVRELATRMVNFSEEEHESETVNSRVAECEEVRCLEEKLKERDKQIEALQKQLEQNQRLLEYYKASFWRRWFKRKS